MPENKSITFETFKDSKQAQKLIELYQGQMIICLSQTWPGKTFPLMLQLDNKGLHLYYYAETFMFKGWGKTLANNNEVIPHELLNNFTDAAQLQVRAFYKKINRFLES